MAKRRKSSCSSDDFEPISDGDDQSYHPSTSTQRARATKKPRNTKAQKGKARQRPKKDEGERFSNNLEDETGSAHATPSHPVSIHTISRSLPLQVALLEWYNQVHEIRGMPWRKPYDPSFGPDQQSQRAYEVSTFHGLRIRLCSRWCLIPFRFGYPRSCCSKLRWPP